jgi:hypothetical protein
MANKVTQQFFGGLLGLPEGSNPFAFQDNGRNIPFHKLLWNIGSPGGYGSWKGGGRTYTGNPGGPGTGTGGGTTSPPPPPSVPRWAFPDYTQDWAFTPPAPQWYPAPPPFDASKYPAATPPKK